MSWGNLIDEKWLKTKAKRPKDMGDNKKFSEIIAIEVLEENESRTKKKFFSNS